MTEREISDFGTRLYLDAFAVGRILARVESVEYEDAVERLAETNEPTLDNLILGGQAMMTALKTLAMRLNRNALGDAQEILEREDNDR